MKRTKNMNPLFYSFFFLLVSNSLYSVSIVVCVKEGYEKTNCSVFCCIETSIFWGKAKGESNRWEDHFW